MTICRPELLEPHLFPASAPGGLPISAAAAAPDKKTRRRSWASSDYLAERLQHFSTYMKVDISCLTQDQIKLGSIWAAHDHLADAGTQLEDGHMTHQC